MGKIELKGHLAIAGKAFPVILANAAVPLLGLADTAAIGHTGSARELGAIALGGLVFSFIYWGFGFLRMGTTGFTAQALGEVNYAEVHNVAWRSCLVAIAIGSVLLVLQYPIMRAAIYLLDASEAVTQLVRQYFMIRIWSAPAALATFALNGVLVGLGKTRQLLWLQLLLNGLNISFNLFFVIVLDWGVAGIATGTVLAEWISMLLGLAMVRGIVSKQFPQGEVRLSWSRLADMDSLKNMMRVNGNIMIRTLALLFGFAWFANQGAGFGDEQLAANHVLLQFVSLSAFLLDGYAYVVEMMVGKALGERNETAYRVGLKQANQLAGVTALVLALLVFLFGDAAIHGLTVDDSVRSVARRYLPYASIYILFSFLAFQLDGVFIGATQSREMRNAGVFSLLVFLACSMALTAGMGNAGLWLAFIVYVIVRGLSLWYYLPRVSARFRTAAQADVDAGAANSGA